MFFTLIEDHIKLNRIWRENDPNTPVLDRSGLIVDSAQLYQSLIGLNISCVGVPIPSLIEDTALAPYPTPKNTSALNIYNQDWPKFT